jgi:hypothetical protein
MGVQSVHTCIWSGKVWVSQSYDPRTWVSQRNGPATRTAFFIKGSGQDSQFISQVSLRDHQDIQPHISLEGDAVVEGELLTEHLGDQLIKKRCPCIRKVITNAFKVTL